MGNGPQTATFLDWGERDWLKKKMKKETSQTHNSSHLSRFLSFSEWSVEDGLIGLFIFKERKEKEKAVFSRDSWRWEKGWGGSLQASRAGSLFLRAVWRQKERETMAVFTGPQTERLNWLTVQKCNDLLRLSQAVPRKFEINNNAIRTENQMLNISLDICCRMTFAFLMNC